MKSLFMKHEYFISKSTNETKHSHNISSAGIKYSLLPHGKPNLSHRNFNPKYECLRWCSKDKEVSVKIPMQHRQHPSPQNCNWGSSREEQKGCGTEQESNRTHIPAKNCS